MKRFLWLILFLLSLEFCLEATPGKWEQNYKSNSISEALINKYKPIIGTGEQMKYNSDSFANYFIAISPDGTKILFYQSGLFLPVVNESNISVGTDEGQITSENYQCYLVYDISTGQQMNFTVYIPKNYYYPTPVGFTPDSQGILFSVVDLTTGLQALYVMDYRFGPYNPYLWTDISDAATQIYVVGISPDPTSNNEILVLSDTDYDPAFLNNFHTITLTHTPNPGAWTDTWVESSTIGKAPNYTGYKNFCLAMSHAIIPMNWLMDNDCKARVFIGNYMYPHWSSTKWTNSNTPDEAFGVVIDGLNPAHPLSAPLPVADVTIAAVNFFDFSWTGFLQNVGESGIYATYPLLIPFSSDNNFLYFNSPKNLNGSSTDKAKIFKIDMTGPNPTYAATLLASSPKYDVNFSYGNYISSDNMTRAWMHPNDGSIYAKQLEYYQVCSMPSSCGISGGATDPNLQTHLNNLKNLCKPGRFNIEDRDQMNRYWVVLVDKGDRSPQWFLYDTTTQTSKLLMDMHPSMNKYYVAPLEPFSYDETGSDGLTYSVEGYIAYPQGTNRKNLPVVFLAHGGPEIFYDYGYYSGVAEPLQALTNAGYAVMFTNFRQSWGQGQNFAYGKGYLDPIGTGDNVNFKFGMLSYQSVSKTLHWAIDRGIVDPKRIGVSGYSWGGYIGNALAAFEPGLIQCAVQGLSAINLVDLIFQPYLYLGGSYATPGNIGRMYRERANPYPYNPAAPPANYHQNYDPNGRQRLMETCPLFNTGNITIPIYIYVGNQDPNVLSSEHGFPFYQKLFMNNNIQIDDRYGEGHSQSQLNTWKDSVIEIFKFYSKYLGGRYPNDPQEGQYR